MGIGILSQHASWLDCTAYLWGRALLTTQMLGTPVKNFQRGFPTFGRTLLVGMLNDLRRAVPRK
jgi:hypothetical protein